VAEGAGVGAEVTAGAAGFGATGAVACFCRVRSKVRGVEEAAASFCCDSKPNMSTVYLHDAEGRPPSSKRPEASVVVVILASLPHSAVMVAPGIVWSPERT
jgi:hypothetical protein